MIIIRNSAAAESQHSKLKSLQMRMREIEALEAQGKATLNQRQVAKLKSKSSILDEIAALLALPGVFFAQFPPLHNTTGMCSIFC